MNVPEETFVRRRKLMFNSEPLARVGQRVRPDKPIAVNMLPLPRLFFISVFRGLPGGTLDGYTAEWLVEEGQSVEIEDKIAIFHRIEEVKGEIIAPGGVTSFDPRDKVVFRSPLSGVIETILPETGLLMLREDIDYTWRGAEVQVGQRMNAWGRKLKRYLKREVGSFVEKGQILAQKIESGDESSPGSFVFARSPIAGIVKNIDLERGLVHVKRDFREVELKAGFFGEVTSLTKNYIEITARGFRIQGVCGIGEESFGRLRVAVDDNTSVLKPDDIRDADVDTVLVGGAYVTLDALERAREVGISGLITGGADHLDLCELIGSDFAVGITGREKIHFPVIITGEFGDVPMDEGEFDFFRKMEGRWAHLNPVTHMRAGVLRPEIIIMSEEH